MAGYTHTTIDADGIPNHHFKAAPTMSMTEARQAPSLDLGRSRFAQPHRYRYDPESEIRDSDLQRKRVGFR